jgi:hypothetical protein
MPSFTDKLCPHFLDQKKAKKGTAALQKKRQRKAQLLSRRQLEAQTLPQAQDFRGFP